ncbi:RsiV family protein [Vineibacter terrae]|nr:RsiV family protein [Vineibacter terrae]
MRSNACRSMVLALALAAAIAPVQVQAQAPAPADCDQPATAVAKAACAQSLMAAAEKALAAAYDELAQSLQGPARNHLRTEQEAWRAAHNRICSTQTVGSVTGDNPLDRQECILARTHRRTAWLRALPAGADYPYIAEHARTESGAVPGIRYAFSAIYPRFERPGVDYRQVNKRLSAAADAMFEKPDAGDVIPGQTQRWSRELDYSLVFATPRLVSVISAGNVYLGGAHPVGGLAVTIVDLRTGRLVTPRDLFVAGFEDKILPMVQADLRRQFHEQPGFDAALEPARLRKLLRHDARWAARGDAIDIEFNVYEVGPYASGPYTVSLPYTRIAALIRRDGPLAGKAR